MSPSPKNPTCPRRRDHRQAAHLRLQGSLAPTAQPPDGSYSKNASAAGITASPVSRFMSAAISLVAQVRRQRPQVRQVSSCDSTQDPAHRRDQTHAPCTATASPRLSLGGGGGAGGWGPGGGCLGWGVGPGPRCWGGGGGGGWPEVYGMTHDDNVKEKLQNGRPPPRSQPKTKRAAGATSPSPTTPIIPSHAISWPSAAARDAGIKVEKDVIDKAVEYRQEMPEPRGGFSYVRQPWLGPLSRAAAQASLLYYAGSSTATISKRRELFQAIPPRQKRPSPRDGSHYYYGDTTPSMRCSSPAADYWGPMVSRHPRPAASLVRPCRHCPATSIVTTHLSRPDHPPNAESLFAGLQWQRPGADSRARLILESKRNVRGSPAHPKASARGVGEIERWQFPYRWPALPPWRQTIVPLRAVGFFLSAGSLSASSSSRRAIIIKSSPVHSPIAVEACV